MIVDESTILAIKDALNSLLADPYLAKDVIYKRWIGKDVYDPNSGKAKDLYEEVGPIKGIIDQHIYRETSKVGSGSREFLRGFERFRIHILKQSIPDLSALWKAGKDRVVVDGIEYVVHSIKESLKLFYTIEVVQ